MTAKTFWCGIPVIALLITAMVAPAAAQDNPWAKQSTKKETLPANSPCFDLLFLELQKKAYEELTSAEKRYYDRQHSACETYKEALLRGAEVQPPQVTTAPPKQPMNPGAVIAISILGSIVALVIIGAIAAN